MAVLHICISHLALKRLIVFSRARQRQRMEEAHMLNCNGTNVAICLLSNWKHISMDRSLDLFKTWLKVLSGQVYGSLWLSARFLSHLFVSCLGLYWMSWMFTGMDDTRELSILAKGPGTGMKMEKGGWDSVKVWRDKYSEAIFLRQGVRWGKWVQLTLRPGFTLEAGHLLAPTKSVLCSLAIFS